MLRCGGRRDRNVGLPCLPGCKYGANPPGYRPEDNPSQCCRLCHPVEFRRRVAQLKPAAESFARVLTFNPIEGIECDVCGNDTARARDGFCRRCGAPGDTSSARYVSYQVIEGARLSREGAWDRPVKPRKEVVAPVKTGPEQIVSAVLLTGPVVEKRKGGK